jgi:hypothetical protein
MLWALDPVPTSAIGRHNNSVRRVDRNLLLSACAPDHPQRVEAIRDRGRGESHAAKVLDVGLNVRQLDVAESRTAEVGRAYFSSALR